MNEAPNLRHLRMWIGRERNVDDSLSAYPAQALAAALDHTALPEADAPLPPCWEWLYFHDTPRASGTGPDGHARTGTFLPPNFLPPVPLPRRMWAASSVEYLRPLMLNLPATRSSVVEGVDFKSGRAGPLLFVTVAHRVSQRDSVCVRERQTLVYRSMPTGPATLPPGEPAPADVDWTRTVTPDPVLLFRYSALTYNGHRIHYDRLYAVGTEFYPGLVVQGPLLATLLLDLMREFLPQAQVASYEFRALRPTFEGSDVTLHGRQEPDGRVRLWSADADGCVCMHAEARLA